MRQRVIYVLAATVLFCGFSLMVKENYPFSNYPMYANPSKGSEYFHLADGDGNPLPISRLAGVTAPKLGKILRKRGDDLAKELGTSRRKLEPDAWVKIGSETLAYLRAQAAHYGNEMPERMRIMLTTISYEDGKIKETPSIVFGE